ncbi:MAG: carbonic anhydrase family protein [Porticoccaceae bacterium]
MKNLIVLACALLISGEVYCATESHSKDRNSVERSGSSNSSSAGSSSRSQARSASKWTYSGSTGPERWAKIGSANGACAGKNQSPINLTGFVKSNLKPIKFDYQDSGQQIVNNGHTVQVTYGKRSHISLDNQTFNLLQFHFHSPSENHINGQSFPLEAHLVHADSKGNLAVVSVMFSKGAANKGLSQAWEKMPEQAGEHYAMPQTVNAIDLLPKNRNYYRFNGSLTTPPCSEGVRWLVMKTVLTASEEQIDAFTHSLHEPNNRPLQPLNARVILE